MTDPLEELKDINLEQEIREKYRVSWEKSIKKFESFCREQDDDFKYAMQCGYFLPKFSIEKIAVKAKPRKLRAEYSLEVIDELNCIIHPDVYKSLYKTLTEAQDDSFFGKLIFGWKLFNLSFNDWMDVMYYDDYVEEFFEYLGYSGDL